MNLIGITEQLVKDVQPLQFGPPVTHVYNPLEYAFEPYKLYLQRFGKPPKEVVLVGMNPGPWGMAQTGIPFGEIHAVKHWMGIEAPVDTPGNEHPKRPVEGFECTRSEVSGRRLWGWAQNKFKTPERFFSRFFVANYCPLQFIEESGRNRTPNQLRASERKPLLEICDRSLRLSIKWLKPKYVIGVGQFAAERSRAALSDQQVTVDVMTHPSPANPKANRGWEKIIEKELSDIGIRI
ncbi:MAG: single-stranded DNA-binding protein [Deltaproteobacteria bacterium]|jgi:single-strand selective monofunctional uracil DNA glycosylase|nr:single-stranded DNA-binding protein [Deltaproteobacteria bacterium]